MTVVFVAQIIVGIGLTSHLAFRNGQRAVENLAHQLMETVSDRISQQIESYLSTAYLINRFNADAFSDGDLDLQNTTQLIRHLYEQIENFDSIDVVSAATQDGKFVTFSRHSGQINFLQPDASTLNEIDEYAVDQHGNQKALLHSYQQSDATKRPWYQIAVEQRQSTWVPIFQMGNDRDLSLSLSVPVYESNTGALRGVFSTGILLSRLNYFLRTLTDDEARTVFVMERNGLLVGTSTSVLPYTTGWQEGAPQYKRVNAADSQAPIVRDISRSLHAQFKSFDQIEENQYLQLNLKDDRYFVNVLPFRSKDGLDWLIVTATPESVFMAPISASTQQTWYLLSFVLVGAIALATILAQWIATPIQTLSRAARSLAQQAADRTIATHSPTRHSCIAELSIMAQSFEQMSFQLRQLFESLNSAWLISEAKFTKVFRVSPDAISLTTLADGRFIEVNDTFLQTYGFSRDQVIGRTTFELGLWSNAADRDRFRQLIQETGHISNLEVELQNTPTGTQTLLLSAELIHLDGIDCVLTLRRNISDRKQLENQLKASETRLNDVLNSVNAAIGCFYIFADQSHREIYRSAGHEAVFGYTADEFSADPNLWRSRVLPEDIHSIDFWDHIFNERTAQFEYRFRHKDGSLRWISETFTSHHHATEDCWIVTFVETDLTQRKQLEESLKESEIRFRQIAANIHQFFFIRSAETGQFLYVSPAYETLWGRSCDSLYENPDSWLDNIYPDDRILVQTSLKTQFQGNSATREYRIIHHDGSIRWIAANVAPVTNEAGQILHYVGTAEDITERKQLELALQTSETQYRLMFETNPNPMWIYDLETLAFLRVNQAAIAHYGYSEAEFLALSPLDIRPPEDVPAFRRAIANPGVPARRIGKHRKRDGSLMDVEITSSNLTWEGKTARFVLAKDITLRKQAEAMLQKSARIVSATPDGIALVDRNYVYTLVNHTYLQRHDKTYDEIVGHSVANLLDPDVFESAIRPRLDRCFAGETIQYEEWFTYKVMGSRFISVTYAPYLEADGSISGAIVTSRDITDLKQAEQTLQDQGAFLRSVYDGVQESIFVVDVVAPGEFRFVGLNSAHERFTGLSTEFLIGKTPAQVLSPEWAATVQQHYQDCVDAGTSITYEEYLPFQGHEYWWLTQLTPIRNHHNQIVRIIGTSINTTDLNQAEREVKRLNLAMENVIEGVAQIDLNGNYVSINPAYANMMGYTPEEIIGMGCLQSIHPDDVEQAIAANQEMQRTGRAEMELRGIRKDGSIFYKQVVIVAIYDNHQQQTGHYCFAKDATRRKQAETALQESEQQLRQIADNIEDVFFLKDFKSGQLIYLNPAYEQLYQQPSQLLYDNPSCWIDHIHPDDRDRILYNLEFQNQGDRFFDQEYRVVLPDGSIRWIWDRTFPIYNEAGDIIRFAGVNRDVTGRKLMEEALRTSQERLNSILNSLEDMVWSVSCEDYSLLYMSPAVEAIYGYSVADFTRNPRLWMEVVHPDDLTIIETGASDLIRTGSKDQHYRITRSDGTMRWIQVRARLIYDSDCNPIRIDGITTDITQRKQAEDALHQSEERLRLITEALPVCISYIDAHQIYQFVNKTYEIWFECPREEIIGRSVRDILGDAAHQKLQGYIHQVLGGEAVHYEAEVPYLRGGSRYVDTIFVPVLTETHETLGFYSLVTDISDRKHAALALQTSEARFRSIFEQAGIGMTLVESASGKYFKVNQRFCQMLGYTEAELLERTWEDITYPDDINSRWFTDTAQILTGQTMSASREKRYVCKNGSIRWVNLTLSRVQDASDSQIYEIAVVEDIQARKQVQEQLQDSLKEKDVLLSEIHHRVKNNLQIIFSLLDLQAMRTSDPQIRAALEDSCSRIYSMALVHERLYRSQNFAEIKLTDYVQELVLHLLQTYRSTSGIITPELDISSSVTVSLDQAIPCGLLLNELITNALKHGFPDGQSGKLYISLDQTESQLLCLRVANDGDRLPDNFALDMSVKSMGLRLVLTLVDQLNGAIEIVRGDRTCFIVTFPPYIAESSDL